VRLKWWQSGAMIWRDAALSHPDPEKLPQTPLPDKIKLLPYPAEAKPVFFGHYKMHGSPMIDAPNAACLDYPKVAGAYKWAGEVRLDPKNLILID
jgi:hypothetical protein